MDPQYFVPDLENGLFSTEATYGLSWVYVKEHNFYADQLVSRGYTSDDEIFEMTRNHIISSHINIIYNEFLPILIGKKTAKRVVKQIKNQGFNRKDIPTISNEIFASVIPVLKQLQAQSIDLIDENGNRQRLPLPDPNDLSTFFFIQNYTLAISTYKLDRLIRGLLNSPSKEYNEISVDGLRSFASPFFNLDLIAFVIERTRYDGTANYHAIREYIGTPIYGNVEGCPNPEYDDCWGSQDDDNDNYEFFYEKTNKVCNPSDVNIPRDPDPIECFIAVVRSSESGFCLSDQEAFEKASLLKSLYNRIDLIDAFVGMIYEGKGSIGNGGILGNTAHVLAKNYFKRLATSDRLLEFLRDDNDEFEAVSMGQMIENALPQLTVGEKGAFNTFGHSG